jgi:hypothetical protein
MIQLILFLALGSGLIVLLFLMARRTSRANGGVQVVFEARQALVALQVELLPPEILKRLFERRDFEYVTKQAPQRIQELFVRERQQLVLSWIGQIRKQVVSLKEFHLGSARFHAGLSPGTELRLAAEFFFLLAVCRALEIAVRWRGPYAAPRIAGRAAAATARVCDVSAKSLEFLRASQFEPFAPESIRNSTLR